MTTPAAPMNAERVPSEHWTRTWQRHELARLGGLGVAGLLFTLLLVAVRVRWLPMESIDRGIADRLNDLVAPSGALVDAMKFISLIGSHGVLGWLVAIGATLLIVRKQYRLAGYLLVTAAGALILDPTLKLAVGRLRPVVDNPVAMGGGNSFPSGHALGSLIVYGALLLVFLPALRTRWRHAAVAVIGVVVLLVGFSRMALSVHFLSDVLGAWALGIAWLGLSAYAFELWRYGHGQRVTEPLEEGLQPEAADDLRPTGPPIEVHVVARGWAVAGGLVTWVLLFGVLVGMGIPLARYRDGNGNVLGDRTVPHWLSAHREGGLDRWSLLGSEVGNTHTIMAIGLIVGAFALAAIRRWRPVLFLLAVMFGELTLFLATAAIVDRARPDVTNMDGPMPTSSFPSGHVAATLCIWMATAVLIMPRTRAWWRWVFVALAVVMPLIVAASRIYRGMHHPTDVLGSIVLAAVWIAVMVYFVRPNCDLDAKPCAEDAPSPGTKSRVGASS